MPSFGVRMPYFLQKSLDFNRLLCHTHPHSMANFGGIFFANLGGGGVTVRMIFRKRFMWKGLWKRQFWPEIALFAGLYSHETRFTWKVFEKRQMALHSGTQKRPLLHLVSGWQKREKLNKPISLVAPYCAIPRDYLSDTPPIARYGVFGVSTWPIGCDTPFPFSERFPSKEHAKWRCNIPPPKGVSQRYWGDTLWKQGKANGCDTPLCATISKGYCAIWRRYLALGR